MNEGFSVMIESLNKFNFILESGLVHLQLEYHWNQVFAWSTNDFDRLHLSTHYSQRYLI